MMRHCQSCGGIIGQDCFNPDECAWITMQMERDRQRDIEERLAYLERRDEQDSVLKEFNDGEGI